MPLIVDKIKCVEESNEVGSDDIYIICFVGRTVAPYASAMGLFSPGAWTDFDTGETHHTDVNLNMFSAPDAVYVVMLVEKDHSRDVSLSTILGAWQAQTDLIWKSIMFSLVTAGLPTGTSAAKSSGFAGIRNALNGLASIFMEFPKGDDDVIDVKQVTITNPGTTQTIRFRSNAADATYDVTFKHVAP